MSLTCPVSFPVLCFMCCWRMLNPLWPVVWKLQKSCDSFDPLRCKACAQLSEKACHEVRAQATQQVSNKTRATVLEKVGQELTLPWKQEKKWKEMKRNEKKSNEIKKNIVDPPTSVHSVLYVTISWHHLKPLQLAVWTPWKNLAYRTWIYKSLALHPCQHCTKVYFNTAGKQRTA